MKCVFLIALFVFSVQEVLMYSAQDSNIEKDSQPCLFRLCAEEYVPVCGKQKVGDCWDVQIFNSSCIMDQENDCGKANYVPCVEEKQCGH